MRGDTTTITDDYRRRQFRYALYRISQTDIVDNARQNSDKGIEDA